MRCPSAVTQVCDRNKPQPHLRVANIHSSNQPMSPCQGGSIRPSASHELGAGTVQRCSSILNAIAMADRRPTHVRFAVSASLR